MNQTHHKIRQRLSQTLAALVTIGLLCLHQANAANVFWDSNGTTPGAGDPATGTWGTTNIWNTDTTGGAGTFSSTVGAANDAFFSAGSDAASAFAVTVVGTNAANSVSFQEGIPTLNGGVIALTKSTTSTGIPGSFGTAVDLAGTATVNSGINIDATGSGNPLLKLIVNNGAGDPDLTFTGVITRAGANTFGIRVGGAGSTRITSSLAAVNGNIEGLSVSPAWNGPLTIAGNQPMTTSFFFRSTTAHGAGAQLILGDGLSDVQSWAGLTVDNATPTVAAVIRSTATMTGALAVNRSVVQIPGALNCAGTLTVGGSAAAGTLQLSDGVTAGTASFGGLSVGAFAGSVISGGAVGMSTLTLSNNGAATVTGNLTISDNIQFNKKGAGTLTLGGSHSYVGATIVTGGRLDLTGTIASSVTVSNGASIGGEGSTSGSLTFGASSAGLFADPVSVGVLTVASVDASASVVTVIPSASGSGVVLQSATPIVGVVGVNFISGGRGSLSTNVTGDQLIYTDTGSATLTWTGNNGTNPTFWDALATTNWLNGGSPDKFFSGDNVVFNDSASSFTVVGQGSSLSPGGVTISNTIAYFIGGANLSGSGRIAKTGSGTAIVSNTLSQLNGLGVTNGVLYLTQTNLNSFAGALNLDGGTLKIDNMNTIGGLSSTRPVELSGGTLEYGYAFTNSASQTTDTVPFELDGGTSTVSITGVTTNSLNRITQTTLRLGKFIVGPGNLIKSGAGTLSLGKNSSGALGSTFTGTVLVNQGSLDIRNPDSLGDVSAGTTISGAGLEIFPFGQNAGVSFDAEPLTFAGSSFFRAKNEDVDSHIFNVWNGPITISPGAVVGITSPRAVQSNPATGAITNVITAFDSRLTIAGSVGTGAGSVLKLGFFPADLVATNAQTVLPNDIEITGALTGPGAVVAMGNSNSVFNLSNNNYSGDTTVAGGTLKLGLANLASNSDVSVATGAVLQLDFTGVTNTIGTLVLGDVPQAPGVYDSINGAPFITGGGSLLVTALPVANYPTNITSSVSGSTLSLSWPATHLGWILQGQTNNLSTGISATWSDIPGTAAVTTTNLAIDPLNPAVFFRLRHP